MENAPQKTEVKRLLHGPCHDFRRHFDGLKLAAVAWKFSENWKVRTYDLNAKIWPVAALESVRSCYELSVHLFNVLCCGILF